MHFDALHRGVLAERSGDFGIEDVIVPDDQASAHAGPADPAAPRSLSKVGKRALKHV
jgi:hypothetical protein